MGAVDAPLAQVKSTNKSVLFQEFSVTCKQNNWQSKMSSWKLYIYTCSLTPWLFFGLHQKFAQPKKKLGSWLRGALSLYVAMWFTYLLIYEMLVSQSQLCLLWTTQWKWWLEVVLMATLPFWDLWKDLKGKIYAANIGDIADLGIYEYAHYYMAHK